MARKKNTAANANPTAANECVSCRGYGYFTEDGEPTIDRRCRKCTDCGGSGTVPTSQIEFDPKEGWFCADTETGEGYTILDENDQPIMVGGPYGYGKAKRIFQRDNPGVAVWECEPAE